MTPGQSTFLEAEMLLKFRRPQKYGAYILCFLWLRNWINRKYIYFEFDFMAEFNVYV